MIAPYHKGFCPRIPRSWWMAGSIAKLKLEELGSPFDAGGLGATCTHDTSEPDALYH